MILHGGLPVSSVLNAGVAELQPVLRRPALMPLMVAEMARFSSGASGWPALAAARLRRMSSTWMRDMGST